MSREYWETVARLSEESTAAHLRFEAYLQQVPFPSSDEELAEADRLQEEASIAHGRYFNYCQTNRDKR